MESFGGGPRWGEVARALGLTLHDPVGPYNPHLTFKGLKRVAGPPSRRPPDERQWLYGRHAVTRSDSVEVIVVPLAPSSPLGTRLPFVSATAIVVRVDPPLFLGLHAWRNAERWFDHSGWDRERVRGVVDAARPSLTALAASGTSARVKDSIVALELPFVVTNPDDVARVLDTCGAVAVKLASIRRTLPRTDAELAHEATWRSFAETAGLAFDDSRMEVSGTIAGARVRLALESEPHAAVTAVFVELPGSVGLSLTITKQSGPALVNAFNGIVDLPTGDIPFDDAFVVGGTPAVEVQKLLWNESLRRAIDELGRSAFVFELGDGHLHARYAWAFHTDAALARLLDGIVTVVCALFPNANRGDGPYR